MSTVSYSVAGAAEATGVSPDTIRHAIRAGHIPVRFPKGKDGKAISKPLILAADLEAWVAGAPSERS